MGLILTYDGTQILSLDESGTKTIKTGGKYCAHDIALAYTQVAGGIACIYATYPEGWICSCSNGQVAEDTSGEYLFFVEELGVYTITITNGTLTKSAAVGVSQKWRSYNIGLGVSYIHVTYPAGWTCTCTYGTEVQTASDTSGEFTFTALHTGTYSLIAVNGSTEASKNVMVSNFGTTYNAEISSGYVVYNEGVFAEGVSMTAYSTAIVPVLAADHIYFEHSGSKGMACWLTPFNTQNSYSKLFVDLDVSLASTSTYLTINSYITYSSSQRQQVSLQQKNTSGRKTVSVNITEFSNYPPEKIYIGLSYQGTAKVYKVWYE